jgi:hypothetical protein
MEVDTIEPVPALAACAHLEDAPSMYAVEDCLYGLYFHGRVT